jgi:hypothetical protein
MRIYEIIVEHLDHGMDFRSERICSLDYEEAIRKATKNLKSREKIQEARILASTD